MSIHSYGLHVCENANYFASPQNGKIFILKTRMSQKGTCMRRFGPFLHENGRKWAKMSILSPENGKTFFPKIRNPDFGTSLHCVIGQLHPLK